MAFPRRWPFYAYLGSAVSPMDVTLWSVNVVFRNMVKVPLYLLILLMGACFALYLYQLNTKGLRGFARLWKSPKSFIGLWKWILNGAKTICGMTERKTIWHNSTHVWTKEILHLSTLIISFVTKLISWFYKIVWLVFVKVFSDYFFFVDLVGYFHFLKKNPKFINDFHYKVHATSLE